MTTVKIAYGAEDGHEQIVTAEGWVDCECGWATNRNRLPSGDEQAQIDAAAAFDAEVISPCPYKPELHPAVPPTSEEIADLRAWNDWQRSYANRVRPLEPTGQTGEPDPLHLGPAAWGTHVAAVSRDAAIAQHLDAGGTHFDLPAETAMMGVVAP